HLLQRRVVAGLVHRHVERLAVASDLAHEDRHQTEPLRKLTWNEVQQLARKVDVVERNPRHTELLTKDLRDLGLGDQPTFYQQRTEPTPIMLLQREDFFELLAGDHLRLDEQLAERDLRGHEAFRLNERARFSNENRATTRRSIRAVSSHATPRRVRRRAPRAPGGCGALDASEQVAF